jgi:Transposase DDE domain
MVLVFGYVTAKFALPMYAHRCSPKTYTQWQLFACLVLKEFLKLDYRKLQAVLTDTPELCKAIELTKVPHFTTFQKAAQRLLRTPPARRLLDTTIHVGAAVRSIKRRVELAALDGTGFESHHASSYYVQRREKGGKEWQNITYRRFPKAGILCDCASHMILAVVPGHGPGPDSKHYRTALDEARRRVRIVTLAADAGYDSERSHEYARYECGIRSLIPPLIGRPTDKPPSGYWRRQMKARLHTTRYGQRWQVETVNSMLKRLLDSALRARKRWNQYREIVLRTLALNVMILRKLKVFYRAPTSPMKKATTTLTASPVKSASPSKLGMTLSPMDQVIESIQSRPPRT